MARTSADRFTLGNRASVSFDEIEVASPRASRCARLRSAAGPRLRLLHPRLAISA